jgi:hypothetical protein
VVKQQKDAAVRVAASGFAISVTINKMLVIYTSATFDSTTAIISSIVFMTATIDQTHIWNNRYQGLLQLPIHKLIRRQLLEIAYPALEQVDQSIRLDLT